VHLHVVVTLKLNTVFDITLFKSVQASGRDKFTFELKWYITLCDIVIFEEPAVEPRENSPPNILALKSQACTVRDQILWDERNDDKVRSCHVCTIYILSYMCVCVCVWFDRKLYLINTGLLWKVYSCLAGCDVSFCAVCSLFFSQQFTFGSCHEPEESDPDLYTVFLRIHLNTLLSVPRSS
jgi:hypothetical protein